MTCVKCGEARKAVDAFDKASTEPSSGKKSGPLEGK